MQEQEQERLRSLAPFVDEVDVEPVNIGPEVGEPVDGFSWVRQSNFSRQ